MNLDRAKSSAMSDNERTSAAADGEARPRDDGENRVDAVTRQDAAAAGEAPPRDGSGDMFDGIARRYDLLNSLMSLGLHRRWRRRLVASVEAYRGGRILDLATGTADVAIALARAYPRLRVVGLDPSAGMLEVGRKKVERARLLDRVDLRLGDGQALPFADNSFDAVCIAFGIRNIEDRDLALGQMARVVRPGGRVAILELTQPQGGAMAPAARFHVRQVVPRLGAWLSGDREYRYLQRSIAAFPPPERFARMMEQAGLENLQRKRLCWGATHLFTGDVPRATVG